MVSGRYRLKAPAELSPPTPSRGSFRALPAMHCAKASKDALNQFLASSRNDVASSARRASALGIGASADKLYATSILSCALVSSPEWQV